MKHDSELPGGEGKSGNEKYVITAADRKRDFLKNYSSLKPNLKRIGVCKDSYDGFKWRNDGQYPP